MFYVGVVRYFATGEGVTIYVASGSEESIRKAIPEYFLPLLVLLTPTDWLKAADGDCADKNHQSHAKVLQTYLPKLWNQIEEKALGRDCLLNFFMKHQFNYS
ncbi:hypothetical protein ACKC9G_07750 [Pokkaliibacter sp. CJK22405]|uniref:hypothetical protein n=1 Tax=Pokkaliibacter sp. CJK22405 TaxID=3384615 RepID=UPI003984CCDE